MLVEQTGGYLIEGDAVHPAANDVTNMRAGIPLGNADRAGWLDRLAGEPTHALMAHGRPVLTCSALEHRYREPLRQAAPGLGLLFLNVPRGAAAGRVAGCGNHLIPAALVASQFADLEAPLDEPFTLTVDAILPVSRVIEAATALCETVDPFAIAPRF